MSQDSDLELFSEIIERNGRAIMDKATSQILDSDLDAGVVSSAAKYHTRFLSRVIPVFPALVNLSYEAASTKKTSSPIGVGAALTLFVEAANIHDDIIDQTHSKHNRKTTFGKFGTNLSILAGDLVLVKATLTLCKECQDLPPKTKDTITGLTFEALNKISRSAAKELTLQKRFDFSPRDYMDVVTLRAAVPEAHCQIGAILGGANEATASCLGGYGKTYGVVGTVIDEYMDLLDYQKFGTRLKNECVPLPLLYALQNIELREKLQPLLSSFEVTAEDHKQIVTLTLGSIEANRLKTSSLSLLNKTKAEVDKKLKEGFARDDLLTLISVLERLLCKF